MVKPGGSSYSILFRKGMCLLGLGVHTLCMMLFINTRQCVNNGVSFSHIHSVERSLAGVQRQQRREAENDSGNRTHTEMC